MDEDLGQSVEEVLHHRDILNSIIDVGHDVLLMMQVILRAQATLVVTDAGAIGGERVVKDGAAAAARIGVAFDRVASGVRQAISLAGALGAKPLDKAARAKADRDTARRTIIRRVEDAILREHEGEAADALCQELVARLDLPDLDEDIARRPVKEIILDICADLGLGNDAERALWKRRTPGDLAALAALAGRVVKADAVSVGERLCGAGAGFSVSAG